MELNRLEEGWEILTPFNPLTKKQKDVLVLLLRGESTKSISAQFGVCDNTINQRIMAIYKKFGVTSFKELVADHLLIFAEIYKAVRHTKECKKAVQDLRNKIKDAEQ